MIKGKNWIKIENTILDLNQIELQTIIKSENYIGFSYGNLPMAIEFDDKEKRDLVYDNLIKKLVNREEEIES